MTRRNPQLASLLSRAARSLVSRLRSLRAHPLLNHLGRRESRVEQAGGHPAEANHRPHLGEAIGWLTRAQDATPDGGFSRGYSLVYNRYFRGQGWQPSYPKTTGYIIPTLLHASQHLERPQLAERALRAARWEIEIQLGSGAVQGGVIGEGRSPAVFNTGQVMLGWLAAFESSGASQFADAAIRAGRYLVSVLDPDGHWRKGNSQFARGDATLYNARVSWALAEAGARLNQPDFTEAARRNLRAVVNMQYENGWFPHCCLTDSSRPLLHTIAYTVRGLLEGGRVLNDPDILGAGQLAARHLMEGVREDGWMPGRFRQDWSGAVSWSCLTGEAQMANNWMRLHLITGDGSWLEPVPRVLQFLKRTQNRTSLDGGLRGGIKGSAPMSGDYGRNEILNWATKCFADALMRDEEGSAGRPAEGVFRLA